MKSLKFALCLVALLGVAYASAEQSGGSATPVKEPEWSNAVYLIDDGKLTPLERQYAEVKTRGKALGLLGGTRSFTYKGSTSTMRVQAQSSLVFVMRLEKQVNPAAQVSFNRVLQKKDSREILMETVSGPAAGYAERRASEDIPLRFERYGSASVKITIDASLLPGEYAFRNSTGTYLFTVVEPHPREP